MLTEEEEEDRKPRLETRKGGEEEKFIRPALGGMIEWHCQNNVFLTV